MHYVVVSAAAAADDDDDDDGDGVEVTDIQSPTLACRSLWRHNYQNLLRVVEQCKYTLW